MRAVRPVVPTAVLLTACAGDAPRGAPADTPATVAAAPDARACPEVERDTVVVRGRVERREYRGPPGNGEDTLTDAGREARILVLDEPLEVCFPAIGGSVPPPFRATELHLIAGNDGDHRFPDGTLEVRGTPVEQMSGSHRTRIILPVLSVRAVP